MQGNFTMSQKEANQIEIFTLLKDKQIKQKKAAQLLGITTRQIRRKLVRFRKSGARGLVHISRGRKSNNKVDENEIQRALDIIKGIYHDFGPTFAHEKLTEIHGVKFSVEKLRQAMISEGMWRPKRKKIASNHQMRESRDCEGELVQIDGSPHDWFEGRCNVRMCTLLVYIDDATGKLLHLEFAESENTWSYFSATKKYLKNHGKPLAFYCDKHGVFRVNTTNNGSSASTDSHRSTQFGRAMKELDIELIYAHSPQAKGKVERANKTLQDRLVKEMRLLDISSIKAANHYLPKFIQWFNSQYADKPKYPINVHRELQKEEKESLIDIFTKQTTRILSKNLTCQYQDKLFQIQTKRQTYALRKATVTIKEYQDGSIKIFYKGNILDYTIFMKQPKANITDVKELNKRVDQIRKKISPNHPWRNFTISQKPAVTKLQKPDISTL